MKVDRYADDESSEVEEYRDQRVLERAGESSYNKVTGQDEDDQSVTETSAMLNSDQKKTSVVGRLVCCCITLILLGGIGVGSYFLATHLKQKSTTSSSTVNKATEDVPCQPQLHDIREPLLELHINARQLNREINNKEANLLEHAITEGYNAAANGCTDQYERFMAGSILKNKTMIENIGESEEDGFDVVFGAMKTLILEFETVISCDGCNEDEAFASRYPSTYGPANSTDASGVRRNLAGEPLDAGKIMEEIEKRIQEVLPELGAITDATIHTESDGGVAKMKLRGSSHNVSVTMGLTPSPSLAQMKV
jgi:hypothetical protein